MFWIKTKLCDEKLSCDPVFLQLVLQFCCDTSERKLSSPSSPSVSQSYCYDKHLHEEELSKSYTSLENS